MQQDVHGFNDGNRDAQAGIMSLFERSTEYENMTTEKMR